jgi:RecG-like helicase
MNRSNVDPEKRVKHNNNKQTKKLLISNSELTKQQKNAQKEIIIDFQHRYACKRFLSIDKRRTVVKKKESIT